MRTASVSSVRPGAVAGRLRAELPARHQALLAPVTRQEELDHILEAALAVDEAVVQAAEHPQTAQQKERNPG